MNMYYRSAKKLVTKMLTAFIRISKFMTFGQRRNMKAFIESQFGYCPLVWMFCGRQTNARINYIHHKSFTDFLLLRVKSVNYGLKALKYFGLKICNIFPSDIKISRTLRLEP